VTLQGGVTADDVVFNLPTATSVTLDHDTLSGTVLAPVASVTTSHLVVTGGGVLVDLANFANDDVTGPLFAGCVPIGRGLNARGPESDHAPGGGVAVFGAAGVFTSAAGTGSGWARGLSIVREPTPEGRGVQPRTSRPSGELLLCSLGQREGVRTLRTAVLCRWVDSTGRSTGRTSRRG